MRCSNRLTAVCLEKRGYVLGRNLEFERRGAGGRFDLLLGLLEELVASTVDVILAIGYPAALPPTQRPAQRHCNFLPEHTVR